MARLDPTGVSRILSYIKNWVTTALGGKANSNHTHTKSQITDFPSLATVATSGSYTDLSNKPTIPTVNNATLTIQKNGTTINSFTANASSNVTANITVPTKTSDLTNDSGYITSTGSCSYSTTSGTSTYSTYLNSLGAQTPKSGRDIFHSGVYTYTTYTDTNTPAHYGAVIGYGNGQGGSCEMFAEWVGKGNLWFRVLRDCDDSWTNWQRIITSDNIGSQSVNYANSAGSAGSVAWGNVSGRPTAVSQFTNDSGYITTDGAAYPRRVGGVTMNFNWSGQGGQPTWLWGGEDGTNMYVYNPANFSVNYANSAGSVAWDNVSGKPSAFTPYFANGTWYAVGDDAAIGDHNVGGGLGVKALNSTTTRIDLCYKDDASNYKSITYDGTTLYMNGNCDYATNSGYTNWLRTSSHSDHLFHTEWDGSYFWTYVTASDGGYRAVRVERSNSSGYADSAGSVAWGNVSGRPWALSQFTNDSGFLTSHQSLSGYVPRSGGAVMTGNALSSAVNNNELRLDGGTGWSQGASVVLTGKDNRNYTGYVRLVPQNGSVGHTMRLAPDGGWDWDGTPVQYASDARLKQQISNIDNALLDAWEDVLPCQFKYNDAVEQKGTTARLHTGYVVQQIDEACKSHNLDISAYGLYCHEEYPEETEEVEVEQEDGTKIKERKVIREASEHYSLRYTEALIVECAYLRREVKRLSERLEKLEK